MTETLSLNVTGMKCGGCEANVKTAVQKLDGIVSVQASAKENKVDVEFETGKTDESAIKQAITSAGFNVV